MKFNGVTKTLAASAVALLVAGCGGGGGGSSLQLSGTAATGAALADAQVEVQCAQGEGSATTNASGGYTVHVGSGQLPCLVQVKGTTAGGVEVTLHSIADEAGPDGVITANVTPVTEMIVAYLLGALPAEAFANFDADQVTPAAVAEAAKAIVAALKDAGVDLTGIDPLKDELVPAVNGSGGNAYDKLLDTLGETVTPESLPMVVNQIAAAGATGGSAGSSALGDAMVAVSSGALQGCPVAVSGRYRFLDYNGALQEGAFDFKKMTITIDGDEVRSFPVTRNAQACEVEVSGSTIAFGPGGVGIIHSVETIGYVIPVQSHTLASLTGTWTFMEGGVDEDNELTHFMGKIAIAADGKATVCEYNLPSLSTCTVDGTDTVKVRADGGFTIVNDDGMDTRMYGFRAPTGEISLFGTNNPGNSSELGDYRTHWVMTRTTKVPLPAVDTVNKYWQLLVRGYNGSDFNVDPVSRDSSTVIASDAAADKYTRRVASDSRVDSFRLNYPVEGLRYRAPAEGITEMHQLVLPGLGISPFLVNSSTYGILVTRP